MSQTTEGYTCLKVLIIPFQIVWTQMFLLDAHAQIVYCNSAKFYQYWFMCLRGFVLTRNMDRQTDVLSDFDLPTPPPPQ